MGVGKVNTNKIIMLNYFVVVIISLVVGMSIKNLPTMAGFFYSILVTPAETTNFMISVEEASIGRTYSADIITRFPDHAYECGR